MKKLIAYICSLSILSGIIAAGVGEMSAMAQYTSADLETAIASAAAWTKNNIKLLDSVGSNEADLSVIAMKRAGIDFDYEAYLDKLDGVAERYDNTSPATDMQRSLMAVIALGGDSGYFGGRDFAGDSTYYRALNGITEYAGALIALNAGNIEIPQGVSFNKEETVRKILSLQNEDGGFGDVYTTATAIVALSKNNNNNTEYAVTYADERGSDKISGGLAIYNAIDYLSRHQSGSGDFYTLKDTAAVIMAMDSIGVSESDSRMVKKKNTVMDGLLTYQNSDGSFSNDYGTADKTATAYAMCAMVSNSRVLQKKAQFFNFSSKDSIRIETTAKPSSTAASATSKPSSSTAGATKKPTTVTSKPRTTIRPRTSASPSATPKGSALPRLTPSPTRKPDLVGPAQFVGPRPTATASPDFGEEAGIENKGISKAVPVSVIIFTLLLAAAVMMLVARKKNLWIFAKKQSDNYKAKRHRKTEEHRKYEKRRRYEERGKYKRK